MNFVIALRTIFRPLRFPRNYLFMFLCIILDREIRSNIELLFLHFILAFIIIKHKGIIPYNPLNVNPLFLGLTVSLR
jgi:hypothetical protein